MAPGKIIKVLSVLCILLAAGMTAAIIAAVQGNKSQPEPEKISNIASISFENDVEQLHTGFSTCSDINASSDIIRISDMALININTADARALMELPGIGETKAKAIVAYRLENGYFGKTEDIMEVSGIGEKTYEAIKAFISV